MFDPIMNSKMDKTIDLEPYNLGIPALVMSGGGTKEINDAELAQRLFTEVKANQPKYALIALGADVFRCTISTLTGGMFGLFLVAVNRGSLLTAKIVIAPSVDSNTGGYIGIDIVAETM